MADRKEVMSWLEGLTDEDWRRYHSDSEVRNIAKAALELLKEQEPIEPKKATEGRLSSFYSWWYVCGNCGRQIDPGDKYCCHCGRGAKWDEI